MSRHYLRGYAVRADDGSPAAEPGRPIPFVLATSGRKADGIDLRMDTLDLTRYLGNPVLGYGHAYWGRDGLPIGRVVDPRVEGDRLLGGLVFDPDDEFAVTVERKIRAGFLNAVSVGFDAFDIDQAGVPRRWELYETSVVPMPMDPDAVQDAEGRALARALGGLRAGKVLSAKNKTLVEAAIEALTALMDAAVEQPADNTGDGRAADPALAHRLARLRL
ncbi:hypothetical protein ACFVZ3_22015 [Kitasatospora purpeofusca]|uniref:hypothetical protein n=1 Tax=Kitasatospora purpeofusca TaxID=67352 RepID=UPI0036BAACD2